MELQVVWRLRRQTNTLNAAISNNISIINQAWLARHILVGRGACGLVSVTTLMRSKPLHHMCCENYIVSPVAWWLRQQLNALKVASSSLAMHDCVTESEAQLIIESSELR